MSAIHGISDSASTAAQVPGVASQRLHAEGQRIAARGNSDGAARAGEVREAFTSFVGQTFFAQMLQAMRATVGEPAYFHGGRAEEIFRTQLDQVLAEEMTEASADRFAEPMFRHQFPKLAAALDEQPSSTKASPLDDLSHLRQR